MSIYQFVLTHGVSIFIIIFLMITMFISLFANSGYLLLICFLIALFSTPPAFMLDNCLDNQRKIQAESFIQEKMSSYSSLADIEEYSYYDGRQLELLRTGNDYKIIRIQRPYDIPSSVTFEIHDDFSYKVLKY